MILKPELTLCERRCEGCNRYFATESPSIWKCGHCAQDAINKLYDRIGELERSNAALRGVVTRQARIRGDL